MRQCKKCGQKKPLKDFPSYDKQGRKRHECHECYRERWNRWDIRTGSRERRLAQARKRYAENPSAYWTKERKARARELDKQRLEKNRSIVYEAYGNQCACCGEKEKMFFTIDHVNNDGKKHRKEQPYTSSSYGLYKLLIKNNFPENFQLLCYNCNIGKARNKGICPHKKGSTTIP